MRHLHVRIVVGVLISLLIFMTSTVFANNNNADTEPSVITGKASNRTTLTDENSPMETQNAQCTIKAGNIEASAQASVSKRLEGICGTNQMKMSFEIIEARLIHEINQLKAMIYALLPNQPMNYQPNAFSYSPPYNKPVYHQSTYPTYANSYEDTTKQTTSYTTQTNIPPLQPTTTSNPFKLTTPTDKPVVEKRTTIARTTRTTTESLNVVNTQKPDTKSSTVSSATEKILEFRPVQTKSLNRFRSKHHKPGPRDFEVHKFNNTLLSGGEIRIFTYYWRFENFTSILKSNASFIYSPIFSISGKMSKTEPSIAAQTNDLDSKRKSKTLPLDFFPDCWAKDEERVDVLFNPFRPKNVNPVNYESKLKFWKMLIVKYCNEKGSANVSEFELKNAFMRNGRKPMCLSTVLQDMQNNHEIECLYKYMTPVQHSWKGWAIDVMVKKPASWGWNVVKDRIFQPKNQAEEMENFIVLESVKKQGEILQNHNVRSEILMLDDVVSNAVEVGLSVEGTEYALHFLKKSQTADTATIERNVNGEAVTVVKFAKIDSKTNITESDKAMFNLNQMERILTKRTEAIESQIHQMDEKVIALVREKRKDMAKNYLKRKKLMIVDIDKQLAQLQHVSTLKANIENAKYNAGVVETYKMGAKALKKIYEETGLSVDKVEDVMFDVQDIIDDHDEIQDIVSGVNISNANDIDDIELEQELQDLVNDDRNDNDTGLPQPDRTNPDDSLERRLTSLKLPNFGDLSLQDNEQSPVHVRGS